MGKPREQFGDRRLAHPELVPVSDDYKVLGFRRLYPLWLAVALSPAIYGFGASAGTMPKAVVAAGAALLIGAIVGGAIGRSPGKYGIGFVAQARVAWGARGGHLVIGLRWLVGVLWGAAWAGTIGHNLAATLAGVGPRLGLPALPFFTWAVPRLPSVVPFSWALGCLVLFIGWLATRKGISPVGTLAKIGLYVVVGGACFLLVYAGIASKGFGELITQRTPWRVGPLIASAVMGVAAVLPGLLSVADWLRFRVPKAKSTERFNALSSLTMVPGAMVLAFVGFAVASAANQVSGSAMFQPGSDGLALGHEWAGVGGAVLSLGMWIVAAPLVAVYGTALAWCGLRPKKATYRSAVLVTVGAQALAIPLVALGAKAGIGIGDVTWLLAAPLGVLVADELVARRGKVLLEEAYMMSKVYGPVAGFSLTGTLVVVLSWLLHPRLVTVVAGSMEVELVQRFASSPSLGALSLAASALGAGILFSILAPIERAVLGGSSRPKKKKKKKKKKRKWKKDDKDELLNRKSDRIHEVTNPNFDYEVAEAWAQHDTEQEVDPDDILDLGESELDEMSTEEADLDMPTEEVSEK